MPEKLPEFSAYMRQRFPSLVLDPPLFYSWPVGLRFDLGAELSVDEGRLSQAVDRAAAVFEAVISPNDDIFVVALQYSDDFFWSLLKGLRLPGVAVHTLPAESEEDARVQLVMPTNRSQLDHRSLFQAIANTDSSRSPSLDGRVFVVNPTNDTIFHMYDDRGADLIGAEKSVLAPIYEQFSSWLLEYGRQRMDALFGGLR